MYDQTSKFKMILHPLISESTLAGGLLLIACHTALLTMDETNSDRLNLKRPMAAG